MTNVTPIQDEIKTSALPGGQGRRWAGLFIISAAILLLITGMAKIISALGKSEVLGKPDPILGMHYNYLLLSVGLIELGVAVFCLTTASQKMALGFVAVLSINFLSYRVGLWLIHWRGYCPCMGTLPQAIHLSREQADLFGQIIFIYLISGSFFLLTRSLLAIKAKAKQRTCS